MYYVYKITNKLNEKVYIGKTGNMRKRWNEHLSLAHRPKSKNHSAIHKEMAKCGTDNFIIDIISNFTCEMDSLRNEIFWIAHYKSNIRRYGEEFGYNMIDGGGGRSFGYKHTEETKKRISTAHLRLKVNLGKHHTEETKALIGAKQKGKKVSKETLEKMAKHRLENPQAYINVAKGSRVGNAKLTEENIPRILEMLAHGITEDKIGKIFRVHRTTIYRIRIGEKWQHIPRSSEITESLPQIKKRKYITKEQAVDIITLINEKVSDREIANQFGLPRGTIYSIRIGRSWKNIPR